MFLNHDSCCFTCFNPCTECFHILSVTVITKVFVFSFLMALSFRCGTNHLCDIYLTKAAQTEKIIFEKKKREETGDREKESPSHDQTLPHVCVA